MSTLITLGQASRETKVIPESHKRDAAGALVIGYLVTELSPGEIQCRAIWDFGEVPVGLGDISNGSEPPAECDVVLFD